MIFDEPYYVTITNSVADCLFERGMEVDNRGAGFFTHKGVLVCFYRGLRDCGMKVCLDDPVWLDITDPNMLDELYKVLDALK